MIKIKYKPDPKWIDFYKGDWELAILIGGRGSGKTWNAGNFCTLQTFQNPNYRTLVLRDVSSSINQSILQNIKARFITFIQKLDGAFDHVFDVQENQIKNKLIDSVNILTKGFRQSRVEQQADLKGFEDIDLSILEEAEDLRDEERVNTLFDTLRKEGHKVIIVLNTPDLEHWIVKRYFDFQGSDFKNFFQLIPKPLKGVCQVIVDYRDNLHLPEQTRRKYEAYNDPTSPTYNPEHYAGKILGLATEARNVARKFDINKIMATETRQPLQVIDEVKIYRLPDPNQIYSLGLDPSSGLGKDWTCLTLRGFYPGEKGQHLLYAQMKAKINELETAKRAVNLANLFRQNKGEVFIVPEVNGLGRAVVNEIQRLYDNQFIYKRFLPDPTKQRAVMIPDFGWQTTNANRDKIINDFSKAFILNQVEICNPEELDEMKTFIYNQDKTDVNKGRYEAQEGANDDLIFSDFICLAGFDYIRKMYNF